MQEQLISFEIAKLAKENEFNLECYACYDYEGGLVNGIRDINFTICNHNKYDDCWSAPTQSLLQMWLYERHGCWVEVFMDDDGTFGYLISKVDNTGRTDYPLRRRFKCPKTCLEDGLFEALKLI